MHRVVDREDGSRSASPHAAGDCEDGDGSSGGRGAAQRVPRASATESTTAVLETVDNGGGSGVAASWWLRAGCQRWSCRHRALCVECLITVPSFNPNKNPSTEAVHPPTAEPAGLRLPLTALTSAAAGGVVGGLVHQPTGSP